MKYSTKGYRENSPDKNNPYNIINSGRISMQNVDEPLHAIDNTGNYKLLQPGYEYTFPGTQVLEVPLNSKNMKKLQKGGAASGHPEAFWNGERWVTSSDDSTYSNGAFYANGGRYSANGGPTFPVAGAGAMFANGGPVASFYVDGNGYPTPFAMAPGSGQGSGYLQDLPTRMNFGGIIPGAQLVHPFAMNPGTGAGNGYFQDLPTEMKRGGHTKKLTPQQKQMMMQAMQQQQMGQGQLGMPPQGMQPPMNMQAPPQIQSPGMPQGQPMMNMGGKPCLECGGMYIPHHINAGPYQYGGIPDNDGGIDVMKKGGDWIKGAVNPAHKGYCSPVTKSTCTPRRKAFAMTMKKHHGFHEMGGAVTQGGNMVRDNELYAMGGGYHPQFMQNGGDPIPGGVNMPANGMPSPTMPAGNNYNPGTDPYNPVNNPPPMPGQGGYAGSQGPAWDNTGTTDQTQDTSQSMQRGNGWGYVGAGMAALGAGIGIASSLSDRRDARNLRNKQFNDRSTANQYSAFNGAGSMGDYDIQGAFRPNKNTPTRAGYFPSQMSEYGGSYAMGGKYSQQGGMYHAGQELEMDDAEIARLQKLGYKIQMV